MGKCKFRADWLEKKDDQGYFIKEWAKKHNDDSIFCNVCKSIVSVSHGFEGISRHSKSEHHKAACRQILARSQLRLTGVRPVAENVDAEDIGASAAPRTIKLYSVRDKATIAELRWVLKCIASDYSAASCDGIGELFASMFGEDVTQDFSLGRTKVSYLTTDALAPFFRKELLDDMAGAAYTVSFDETTNSTSAKELQIGVTYWSSAIDRIANHHLQTYFIGSATAKIIAEKINAALDNAGLSRYKFLMLGMDGPNVNKKVERLINEELLALRKKPLISIGSCNIHILHNAFQAGLEKFGSEVSDLVYRIHDFFHQWPLRGEDFSLVQDDLKVPSHKFIKHVPSRWLTLKPAALRVLEQWPALVHYFLKFVPAKRPALTNSKAYLNIVDSLKDKAIKAELAFVCSSAEVFERFTSTFQTDKPMIHAMHDELQRLALTLINKVCKQSSVKALGVCQEILGADHLIPAAKLEVDEHVRSELEQLDERSRLETLVRIQKHIVAACLHVVSKSSLNCTLTKHCRFLQKSERCKARSVGDIVAVAKALPFDVDIGVLQDEYRLLQLEKEPADCDRIDEYWAQFFKLETALGEPKYPTVAVVVKAALSFSHGNAEIERGFSQSSRFLTDDKASMSERMLDAAMTVKSGMKRYNMQPSLCPITPQLLEMSRHAHANYKAYLEEKKD